MSANERQVGGDHYAKGSCPHCGKNLQHWDMVVALDLDYFSGQITKYVARWRNKNGIQDLRKAQHFLEKYIELVESGTVPDAGQERRDRKSEKVVGGTMAPCPACVRERGQVILGCEMCLGSGRIPVVTLP